MACRFCLLLGSFGFMRVAWKPPGFQRTKVLYHKMRTKCGNSDAFAHPRLRNSPQRKQKATKAEGPLSGDGTFTGDALRFDCGKLTAARDDAWFIDARRSDGIARLDVAGGQERLNCMAAFASPPPQEGGFLL